MPRPCVFECWIIRIDVFASFFNLFYNFLTAKMKGKQ